MRRRVTHELEDASRTRCGLASDRLFLRWAEPNVDPTCAGCMVGRGRETVARLSAGERPGVATTLRFNQGRWS